MNSNLTKRLLTIALLFMIAELSYINSKSLFYLANNDGIIHKVFAVLGAVAFSIVTIIIMQQKGFKWQKVMFPFFDAALVFLGFNLNIHPDMRIYLTVFMSLFAGVIMYSLGKIDQAKEDDNKEDQIKSLRDDLERLQNDLSIVRSDKNNLLDENKKLQGDLEVMQGDNAKLQGDLRVMKSDLLVIQSDNKKLQGNIEVIKGDKKKLLSDI